MIEILFLIVLFALSFLVSRTIRKSVTKNVKQTSYFVNSKDDINENARYNSNGQRIA